MSTWNVTEARAHLPEILQSVEAGDEVTLTRHGRPVAVIVRPDAIRGRRATPAVEAAARLMASIDAAVTTSAPPGLMPDRAEEMVAAIRSERDRP